MNFRDAICCVALLALTAMRCLPYYWDPLLTFDSDQAVLVMMAQDLVAGRGFPWFFYGQGYLLGLEAWYLAFVFWITGSSDVQIVMASYGIINLITTGVLFWFFRRPISLSAAPSFFCVAIWAIASPYVGTRLMQSMGANGFLILFLVFMLLMNEFSLLKGVLVAAILSYRQLLVSILMAVFLRKLWPHFTTNRFIREMRATKYF